jgi:hypothetical protein
MKIVIEIDEELYKHTHEVKGVYPCTESYEIYKAIRNGIVLPNRHGRLIDADELIEHAWRDRLDSRERIAEMIENAPTIVLADKEGENDK